MFGFGDRPLRGPRVSTWTAGGKPEDRLPADAAGKLRRLREREEDVRAALRMLAERQRAAGDEKREASARLHRLEGWADGGGGRTVSSWYATHLGGGGMPDPAGGAIEHHHPRTRPTAARLAEAQREIDDAAAKCAAVAAQIEAKQAELNPLVSRLDDYVRGVPGNAILEPHRTNRKSETPASLDELNAVRERIAVLDVEDRDIRNARPPKPDIKQRARAKINAFAAKGAIDYRAAIRFSDRDIEFPKELISFATFSPTGPGAASLHVPMPYEFVCWLFRDEIIRRVEADIDALVTDKGLSDAEKTKRLAEISVLRLQAERDEEHVIDLLEQGGAKIRRRPDADPRAVLGLSSDLPAPTPSLY